MAARKTVLDNIRKNYSEMFSAERKVAAYILKHPYEAVNTNVTELANLSGVSDATVIRMSKRIGYEGYYQMKISLSHDLGRKQWEDASKKEKAPDTVNGLFDVFIDNLKYIAGNADAAVLEECAQIIRSCRMVHLAAVGNTSPIALDLSFRLGRFNIPSTSSLLPEHFLNQVHLAEKEDCLIAISRSGSSKQVLQAANLARQKGLIVISITGHKHSPLSKLSDHIILTRCEHELFEYYGLESHLYEMAVIDVLLIFIARLDSSKNVNDEVELLLSEYKL